MTWVKLDDSMPTHPKVVERSDAAFRALIELWCHAAQHKTDGRVGDQAAKRIAKPKVIAELVDAGLIHRNGAGWIIHDWLDHNMSKSDYEAQREVDAERLRKWRANKNGNAP